MQIELLDEDIQAREAQIAGMYRAKVKALNDKIARLEAQAAQEAAKVREIQNAYKFNLTVIEERDAEIQDLERALKDRAAETRRAEQTAAELTKKMAQLRDKRQAFEQQQANRLQSERELAKVRESKLLERLKQLQLQHQKALLARESSKQDIALEIEQVAAMAAARVQAEQAESQRVILKLKREKEESEGKLQIQRRRLEDQARHSHQQAQYYKSLCQEGDLKHSEEIGQARAKLRQNQLVVASLQNQVEYLKRDGKSWEETFRARIAQLQMQKEAAAYQLAECKARSKEKLALALEQCRRKTNQSSEEATRQKRKVEGLLRQKLIELQRVTLAQQNAKDKLAEVEVRMRQAKLDWEDKYQQLTKRYEEDKRFFKGELDRRDGRGRQLGGTVQQLEAEIERLRTQLRESQQEWQAKLKAAEQLSKQVVEQKARKEKVDSQLFKQSVSHLREEQFQRETEEYLRIIQAMRRDMDAASQKMQVVVQEKNLLKEDCDLSKRRLADRQDELFRSKENSLKLQAMCNQLELQLQKQRLERQGVSSSQLASEQAKVARLENTCSELAQRNRILQGQVQHLQQISAQLRFRVREFEGNQYRQDQYISSIQPNSPSEQVNQSRFEEVKVVDRQTRAPQEWLAEGDRQKQARPSQDWPAEGSRQTLQGLLKAKRQLSKEEQMQPVRGDQAQLHERERIEPKGRMTQSQREAQSRLKVRQREQQREQEGRRQSIQKELRERYFRAAQ